MISIHENQPNPDNEGRLVQLTCDCGRPKIVRCSDDDEHIVFCKECAAMTTEMMLRASYPDSTADEPWQYENVWTEKRV